MVGRNFDLCENDWDKLAPLEKKKYVVELLEKQVAELQQQKQVMQDKLDEAETQIEKTADIANEFDEYRSVQLLSLRTVAVCFAALARCAQLVARTHTHMCLPIPPRPRP